MKKLFVLVLLLFPIILSAQEKYLIYLKDKDIKKGETLSKTSVVYNNTVSALSERCLVRRKKVMNENTIVSYEDVPIKEEYIKRIENLDVKIQHRLKWFNAISAYLSNTQVEKVKELEFVDRIDKVKVLTSKKETESFSSSLDLSKDNSFDSLDYGGSFKQNSLSDIIKVHEKGICGDGVIIGLLDSGFDWKEHECLKDAKVLAEHDFIFNDDNTANEGNDVAGQDSHGTFVFSVVGGYKPGSIIGPAYKAAFILAKTEKIGSETHQEEDNYAAALEWMENLGVDITSSSLGYNTFDDGKTDYSYSNMNGNTTIVTKAAELAFKKGVVVLSSAGNEGNSSWHYIIAPADGFNVIAVGAVNNANDVASFSSRGPTYDGRIKPDLVTQGVSVYGASAHTQNKYYYGNGTSFSCPVACGIAAQLLSLNPNLTNVEIRKTLLEACDNFSSPNNDRGYGLLSAEKAISVYYPSIDYSTSCTIQKKLFAPNSINANSVRIFYSINHGSYISDNIQSLGNNEFSYTFKNYNAGDKIDFYFSYMDNFHKTYSDPVADKTFSLSFGQKSVSLDTLLSSSATSYYLGNNYPNPFNNRTTILFYTTDYKKAEIIIYNILGQKVKTIFNRFSKPGKNQIIWDGRNDSGSYCPSGIYIYTLKIDGNILSNKMILLK